MKTLINITGHALEGSWADPRGHISVAHYEVSPGCFLHLALGEAGLCIFSGQTKVGFPAAELVRLAQVHEPSLQPQPARDASETDAARARLNAKARLKSCPP